MLFSFKAVQLLEQFLKDLMEIVITSMSNFKVHYLLLVLLKKLQLVYCKVHELLLTTFQTCTS